MDALYFRGVAVGLTIAWVTGGIAYFKGSFGTPANGNVLNLLLLELVVSLASFIMAYVIETKVWMLLFG